MKRTLLASVALGVAGVGPAAAADRAEVLETYVNIAEAACTRHADGSGRPALIAVDADGRAETVTFDALDA